jgi:predicted ArsR family transcriptional regulator
MSDEEVVKVATVRDRIAEELTFNGPKTATDLANTLQIQLPNIRTGLAQLLDEGLIESIDGKTVSIIRNG